MPEIRWPGAEEQQWPGALLPPPEAESARIAKDVGTQFGVGVAKSVPYLYGLPGDVQDLAYRGAEAAGGPPAGMMRGLMGQYPTSTELEARMVARHPEGVGARPAAKTPYGPFAEKVGEFALPAAVGPGSAIRKGLQYAVAPGVASELGAEVGRSMGPDYEAPLSFAGAMVGPGIARRSVTPFPATPGRTAAVRHLMDNEGMTERHAPSAGQQTGSTGLRYAESMLADVPMAPQRAREIREGTAEGFTRAALRRAGIDAERATPDVMDDAFARIGRQFETLSARNTMRLDPHVQTDLLNHVADYQLNVNPGMRSPAPERHMNDVAAWAGAQGGQLTGRQYQTTRSQLGAAARGATDPYLSRVLAQMTESLDDAMERSIAAANPRDAGAFGEARRQYRNILPLERAAAGAGEDAAAGIITPARLRQAVVGTQGARAYVRGHGDFSDLVHAGNEVLTPLPNSGTAQRLHVQHMLAALGAIPGMVTGSAEHSVAGMLGGHYGGAAAGTVLAPVAGKILYSAPVQRYLTNQVAPRMTAPGMEEMAGRLAVARALAEGVKPKQAPAQQ